MKKEAGYKGKVNLAERAKIEWGPKWVGLCLLMILGNGYVHVTLFLFIDFFFFFSSFSCF